VACPNECSGRGSCLTLSELNTIPISINSSYSYVSNDGSSDNSNLYGCLCDSSWSVGFASGQVQLGEYFGPDCSLSMKICIYIYFFTFGKVSFS
jgi:hypothetical protein